MYYKLNFDNYFVFHMRFFLCFLFNLIVLKKIVVVVPNSGFILIFYFKTFNRIVY